MITKNISWEGKEGRGVGLTTLPASCADCHEIREPQPPGTLGVSPGLHRECFTCTFNFPMHISCSDLLTKMNNVHETGLQIAVSGAAFVMN
jgi:hypothetical protein